MPRPIATNKSGHVTEGNVLEDLGFDAEEIRETEIKMTIWRPLRAEVEARGLTQARLAEVLKIHQPDASLLLRGRVSKFSITKLMQFAERLNLTVRLMVEPLRVVRHGRAPLPRSLALTAKRAKAVPAKTRSRAKVVA